MPVSDFRYYIIDDSKLDCTIASKIVRVAGAPESHIQCGMQALEALSHLATLASTDTLPFIIVFVDVRMPVMNGFEFVEAFEKLPQIIQDRCVLFMLSSSINESDINRANSFNSVLDFLNKPLTIATVKTVADKAEKHLLATGRITSI